MRDSDAARTEAEISKAEAQIAQAEAEKSRAQTERGRAESEKATAHVERVEIRRTSSHLSDSVDRSTQLAAGRAAHSARLPLCRECRPCPGGAVRPGQHLDRALTEG
jgi:hypothetical protein